METVRRLLKILLDYITGWGKPSKTTVPPAATAGLVSLAGYSGTVRETVGQGRVGMVQVAGELWRAEVLAQDGVGLPPELEPGRPVRIVRQEGLKLWVVPAPFKPASDWEL